MKRYLSGFCLILCLLAVLTGCGAFSGPGSGHVAGGAEGGKENAGAAESGADPAGGAEGSAEEKLSASAELRGDGLALTLHGYCMEEISAKDLQALDGAADPVSAAKALEALRRAAEEARTGGRYHADDISVLVPVTEEDRSSGLSPRELAGNIHGWQDAEGQYHVLISAGNEIFWIRWSGGKENAEEKTPGPAAVLVSGKWGD